MKQDRILIIDLGSTSNTDIAREIRSLGVYTEIYPHDLSQEELDKLENVKGIILNGGENRIVDGIEIDASKALYNVEVPFLSVDHKGTKAWSDTEDERKKVLEAFVFDECKAKANWNIENFIGEQLSLIKERVGDRKVLLALS